MHRAQQGYAALWRARRQTGKARPQPSDIERVKAVDVLGGVDGIDDAAGIYVPWQRQLNEYPIDPVIAIELLDLGDQSGFRGFGRQAELERGESCANASAPLASH